MKNILKNKMLKQFLRFGIVGVINTAHYYLWYFLFYLGLEWAYLVAHLSAFVISMIGSFYMNVYFTYKTRPTLKKFLQFPLTYVLNIGLSTLFLFIMVDAFKWSEVLSPFIAQCMTIPATFLVSKWIMEQKPSEEHLSNVE